MQARARFQILMQRRYVLFHQLGSLDGPDLQKHGGLSKESRQEAGGGDLPCPDI